ncbi:MAG: hypothetical protein ACREFK_01580 [Stellaceae bacterium]
MPPDAAVITFPPHVLPAILCLILALVVLALLCATFACEKRGKRR